MRFVFYIETTIRSFFRLRPERGKMTTINNEKKTLGERIREQRILMKMTQEELAEALHIKKSTVSMYENDKVDIKGSILVELSRTLNTSPNYLLGLEDNKELIEIAIMLKAINDENLRQSVVNHITLLSAL